MEHAVNDPSSSPDAQTSSAFVSSRLSNSNGALVIAYSQAARASGLMSSPCHQVTRRPRGELVTWSFLSQPWSEPLGLDKVIRLL